MIKILFLAANPSETTRLRIDQEIRAIEEKLRHSEYRDKFDLKQHWAVLVADLQGYLLRYRPNIVHFSGHGSASNEIILEDNYGDSQPISTAALGQLFSTLKDNIQCIILNACYSETQAKEIAKYIDCVIGMSQAISDSAAISFSASFYQALGYGKDIKTAFDLGCGQIDLEGLSEQDAPKLLADKCNPQQIFLIDDQSTAEKNIDQVSQRWWKYIAATAVIIGILAGVAEFTGYSLNNIFSPQSTLSNTVTVLVHEEKGKDHLILPNRGFVKLIYGDAIISEQINNEGEATFKQVPEHFFQAGSKVEILFHDPEGEPYHAIHHDSLYQLTKGEYIALAVKLYGLDQIRGIVKDFETGDPIAGARISVHGEETFSNQYGEYSLPIPLEKQRKLQSIRAFKENYHSFELDSVAVQTGREIPILMKPRR